jgi:hypothetical protein
MAHPYTYIHTYISSAIPLFMCIHCLPLIKLYYSKNFLFDTSDFHKFIYITGTNCFHNCFHFINNNETKALEENKKLLKMDLIQNTRKINLVTFIDWRKTYSWWIPNSVEGQAGIQEVHSLEGCQVWNKILPILCFIYWVPVELTIWYNRSDKQCCPSG